MNGSKLVQALITLQKEEWSSFRKYLLMYTSEDSDNFEVFTFLQKRKEKLESLPNIQIIRKKHFSHLSQKSILNIISKLYLWLEEWLVYFTTKNDKMQSDLILVKQFNRRGLYNLADQKSRQLEKQLGNQKGLSIKKEKIKSELYYYEYYSDNPIKQDRHHDPFPKLFNAIKRYHQEKQTLLEAELFNRQIVMNKDYSKLLKTPPCSEITQSLLSLTNSLKNYDLDSFYTIKSQLFSGEFEQGSDVHIIVTYYMLNLVSRLYNIAPEIKANDISELYSYAIESGVLLSNAQLTTTRFNNLVNTIAQTSSINETSQFINKWIHFVDTDNLEGFKDLSEARNMYFHHRYADISNSILLHTYSNPEDKLMALAFTLISLFEDDTIDYDIVFDYSINMKRTIKRNAKKLNQTFYNSILNFTKIIDLLNTHEHKKVEIDINTYHPVFFKTWIIQKIQ